MSISKFVLFKFEEKPVDIGCVTWIKNPFDVEAIKYFEKLEVRWPPAESSNNKPVVYKGKVLLVHSKYELVPDFFEKFVLTQSKSYVMCQHKFGQQKLVAARKFLKSNCHPL